MPVISMFYGIIISMYYLDTKQHHLPNRELLEGEFPNNKTKLVLAWIELRNEELMADWKLAVTGNKVFRIDPLK
jgi:hypothetical protein